jgi:hypothetical protein
MRRRFILVTLLVLLAMMPVGVQAGHDGTWHPGGGSGSSTKNNLKQIGISLHNLEPFLDTFVWVNPSGTPVVHGNAAIQDGTSNTVLVAESRGANASCASTNDGDLELLELTIHFRYHAANQRVQATIDLRDEGISQGGRYGAEIVFDDRAIGSFSIDVVVDFEYFPGARSAGEDRSGTPGRN